MSDPSADDGEAAGADPETDEDPEVPPEAVLDELFATIESRREELPEGSYTASLFTHEKGENAVLEKIGEETTEAILAAKDDDREELTYESADLVYHLLVLFAMKDLDVDDLREELRDRF
ncbi:phosphoribosyl-ATP pyrophosphohydrolase [Halorubrum trapanicum]|uniref:Phosphoribosyl-ATP pyrophosphatase n=1 Tax=Halorubrum trapanicum TaxID=29284 RepID=A0A8J7R7F5_9EURY|nr:phosphoribosyl-ATP diphosphatase [Halorubrum trapanicum]MBP1901634.1 phosphoribosyl-ATP pyrophosphohydrolase [Halorubrum trapanicum]